MATRTKRPTNLESSSSNGSMVPTKSKLKTVCSVSALSRPPSGPQHWALCSLHSSFRHTRPPGRLTGAQIGPLTQQHTCLAERLTSRAQEQARPALQGQLQSRSGVKVLQVFSCRGGVDAQLVSDVETLLFVVPAVRCVDTFNIQIQLFEYYIFSI